MAEVKLTEREPHISVFYNFLVVVRGLEL